MKKIIELAEKALDVSLLSGFYITQEMENALLKLSKAVKDRRELEQIPITEDWLKEHGWAFDYTIEEAIADYCYVTCNGYIKKGEGYLLDWCNGTLKVTNDFNDSEFTKYDAALADLYDACELCGINLED